MVNVVAKFVSPIEIEQFHSLSKEMRDEVKEWLSIIHRVETAGCSLERAAKAEAARWIGVRGRSAENIKTKVRRFRVEGWQCCVNHAKQTGGDKASLPIKFVECWKDLCLDHQRGKIMACRRELIRRWRNGDTIPGYGNWRQWWDQKTPGVWYDLCPPDLPHGWTDRNLRRYAPPKEEMDLAQYGIFVGLKHQPHIIRTRVGLRPLEWVAFDDMETDFMISVPGVDVPVRLAALVCKDISTDMWLRFVLRPAIPRADGTKDGLKKTDMKRLIAELVMNYGYPSDYTMNLVFERGTATLPADDIRALAEITGGMVKSHPTNMITGQVLLSGFADKATGSARSKGWIESGFNLFHNEAAFVKGQKGLSWSAAPAELAVRTKQAAALLEAGNQLNAIQRLQECIPFVDVYQAQETFNEILCTLNRRDDHELEGFDKINKWRLSLGDPWKQPSEALAYPPEVRKHFLWKPFTESPVERFARLLQGMTFERVPDCALPQLLADHRKVTVDKHQIKITVDGRTYTYFDRDCPYLARNEVEWLAYYVETDMDHIYLTDGAGGYKCRLPRIDKVRQGDLDAMKEQMADTKHQLNTVLRRINSRDSRIDKTRRQNAANEQAIQTLQELGAINTAPDTNPAIAGAADVTRGLVDAQWEVVRVRKVEAAFDPLDYYANLENENNQEEQ